MAIKNLFKSNEGGWKIFIYLFLFFLVKGILWLIIGYETVKLVI